MPNERAAMTSGWERDADLLLTDLDREVVRLSGFGQRGASGSRPALLVIDVTEAFCGDRPEPILESIKRFRNSSGEVAWQAVEVIRRLGETARENGLPVFYTRGMSSASGVGPGKWAMKSSRASEDRGSQHRIVEPLEPREGDVVLDKAKPSAFFGTPLLSLLIERGIDSLIVCGCTTSGCVRATVVDAFSNNLAVSVVADGCFDRVAASHTVALFDMNLKYGNVVDSAEAATMLRSPARPASPA
jgi:maleamate amidohydrolase